MTLFQTEEKARRYYEETRQAIALAMEGQWEEAVSLNRHLLGLFPNDVATYNRLGKALMELGQYSQAREVFTKALELSPCNSIARKSLERLAYLEDKGPRPRSNHKASLDLFVEEVGKSTVAHLQDLAPKEVLATVASGDQVQLVVAGNSVVVKSLHGDYLGKVESPLALRLARLIQGGNHYQAAVIHASDKKFSIIIRETYQHPTQGGTLSFLPRAAEGSEEAASPFLSYEGEESWQEKEEASLEANTEKDEEDPLGLLAEVEEGG